MIPLTKALRSSVGKKVLMALSGLALTGFLVTHLAGNLLLYKSDGTPFNLYAHTLESYGPLLYVAEVGLLFMALLHIVTAISLKIGHKSARPQGYSRWKSKGGQTLANPASRNMAITGTIILIFLVVHILHFKYGANIPEGYAQDHKGTQIRDLHRLVVETFQNPYWVMGYVGVMLLLGFHLRHGFWSAFQSLGAMNAKLAKPGYCLGFFVALVLAAGFLGIPLWIYFGGGAR